MSTPALEKTGMYDSFFIPPDILRFVENELSARL